MKSLEIGECCDVTRIFYMHVMGYLSSLLTIDISYPNKSTAFLSDKFLFVQNIPTCTTYPFWNIQVVMVKIIAGNFYLEIVINDVIEYICFLNVCKLLKMI